MTSIKDQCDHAAGMVAAYVWSVPLCAMCRHVCNYGDDERNQHSFRDATREYAPEWSEIALQLFGMESAGSATMRSQDVAQQQVNGSKML